MTRVRRIVAMLFCAAAMPGGERAVAETLPPETARTLAERGDILPLAEVLRRLAFEGQIIGLALHREDGRYLYRIKAIGPGGQYREYQVDAQKGTSAGQ